MLLKVMNQILTIATISTLAWVLWPYLIHLHVTFR